MPSNLISNPSLGAQLSRNPFSYEKVEQIDRDTSTGWLTLNQITNQLNLFEDESQDEYLSSLELATRMAIEDFLGMPIFPIQYRAYYGAGNGNGSQSFLDLPEISVGSGTVEINTVSYYDSSNPPVLIVLDSANYYYDNTGNKVVVTDIPTVVSETMTNPIIVTWTIDTSYYAQYPNIKQAGLLLLTHLYNNRSNTTVETLKDLPFGVAQLLRPYKPLVM
jgi:hypothetical protein